MCSKKRNDDQAYPFSWHILDLWTISVEIIFPKLRNRVALSYVIKDMKVGVRNSILFI